MKPFQIMRLFFISLPLLLSACGGGGGSSIEKPDDAISSKSNSSVSGSQSNSVTIHGAVTTDLLIGAEVLITVGSQSFSTTVLSDRKYQANFVVANENVDTPVVIKVRGKNANNWVELVSLLPSAQKIKTLAGDNRILESAEFIGVNISPMTTAEYAQIKTRALSISNDNQLGDALFHISSVQQLDTAALLNILLTDIKYSLPNGIATTLELVLDVNEASAYLQLLKSTDQFLISFEVDKIKQDSSQIFLSPTVIEGEYFVESSRFLYFLNLNKDGSGRLRANASPYSLMPMTLLSNKYVDVSVNWVRKGSTIKITPSQEIYYGQSPRAFFADDASMSCDRCDVKLHSITLNLFSNNEVRNNAEAALEFSFSSNGGLVSEAIFLSIASMKLLDNNYSLNVDNIVGSNLFGNLYKYKFNSDGTVEITNKLNESSRIAVWQHQNGHITIDDGKVELWITGDNKVGFNVIQFILDEELTVLGRIYSGLLVKQTEISFNEADWLGTWRNANLNPVTNNFYHVLENNQWREGYEPQTASSWTIVNNKVQIAESNTLKMRRELLAYDGDIYYVHLCRGSISQALPTSCLIEMIKKQNENVTSHLWSSSSTLFQEDTTGNVWRFNGAQLYRNDRSDNYVRISENKMYSNNGTILEVLSSDFNSIKVCEYPVWSQCSSQQQYNLTRGVEIKVTRTGTGTVTLNESFGFISYTPSIVKAIVVPKNKEIRVSISPGSVTGCNGQWDSQFYVIPQLTENCELTVNFASL